MVSEKNKEKYKVTEHRLFHGKDGKTMEIIAIAASLTGGTFVSTTVYEVTDKSSDVWKLKAVDENSTL